MKKASRRDKNRVMTPLIQTIEELITLLYNLVRLKKVKRYKNAFFFVTTKGGTSLGELFSAKINVVEISCASHQNAKMY